MESVTLGDVPVLPQGLCAGPYMFPDHTTGCESIVDAAWTCHPFQKIGARGFTNTRRLDRLPRVLWDLQMEWQGRDEVEFKDYLKPLQLQILVGHCLLPVTPGNGLPKPPESAPTIPQESYCHSLP